MKRNRDLARHAPTEEPVISKDPNGCIETGDKAISISKQVSITRIRWTQTFRVTVLPDSSFPRLLLSTARLFVSMVFGREFSDSYTTTSLESKGELRVNGKIKSPMPWPEAPDRKLMLPGA